MPKVVKKKEEEKGEKVQMKIEVEGTEEVAGINFYSFFINE